MCITIIIMDFVSLLWACFKKAFISNNNVWRIHVLLMQSVSSASHNKNKVRLQVCFLSLVQRLWGHVNKENRKRYLCWFASHRSSECYREQKHHPSLTLCRGKRNCGTVTTAQVHYFTLTLNGKVGSGVISHCYAKYVPGALAKDQTWGPASGSDAA